MQDGSLYAGRERSPGVLHKHKGFACLSVIFTPAHSTCAPCNAQLRGRARPLDGCRRGRRRSRRPAAGAGAGKAAEDVRRQRLCRRGLTAFWQPGCAAASGTCLASLQGSGSGLLPTAQAVAAAAAAAASAADVVLIATSSRHSPIL